MRDRPHLKPWASQAGSGPVFTMCGNPNNCQLTDGSLQLFFSFWLPSQEILKKKRWLCTSLGQSHKKNFSLSRAFLGESQGLVRRFYIFIFIIFFLRARERQRGRDRERQRQRQRERERDRERERERVMKAQLFINILKGKTDIRTQFNSTLREKVQLKIKWKFSTSTGLFLSFYVHHIYNKNVYNEHTVSILSQHFLLLIIWENTSHVCLFVTKKCYLKSWVKEPWWIVRK